MSRGRVWLMAMALGLAACGRREPEPSFAPDDPAGPLFEPNHLVEVAIRMSGSDWDAMRLQSRTWWDVASTPDRNCLSQPFAKPFTYFPADVTVDGQTIPHVGIRKKGFIGSLDLEKPALKIRFDHYEPGQTLRGLTRLTLNNSKQDPSYIKQCLAYQVFDKAGLPSPWCNFAHVTLNGRDLALFVHVESVDRRFVRRHFEEASGDLWEGEVSDFRTDYLNTFEKKGEVEDDDQTRVNRDRLRAVASALDSAADMVLSQRLSELIDLERFYTLWATEKVLEHWDGYANGINNFFLYDDPKSDRLVFMPGGPDQIFVVDPYVTELPPVSVYARASITQRLYRIPEARARYVAKLREVLDAAFSEPKLLAEIDRMEALIRPVLQRSAQDPAVVTAAIEGVRTHVRARRRLILDDVAGGPKPWDGTLRGLDCATRVGQAEGSFSTRFGTRTNPDTLAAGSGTLNLTLTAQRPSFQRVGSRGGWDPGAQIDPWISIEVTGLASDGLYWTTWLNVNPALFAPGRVITLGASEASGGLGNWDPRTSRWTYLGFFVDGTLTLDEATTQAGGQLVGRFSARVVRF